MRGLGYKLVRVAEELDDGLFLDIQIKVSQLNQVLGSSLQNQRNRQVIHLFIAIEQ